MARQLVLDLPDDIYMHIQKKARQSGITPEELAKRWIVVAATGVEDPLEDAIGSIQSHIPDWAEQHDAYIGRSVLEKLR